MRKFPKYIGNNVSVECSKKEPVILVMLYNGPWGVGDPLRFEGEGRLRTLFDWLKSWLLDGTPPERGTAPVYSEEDYRKLIRDYKSVGISLTEKRMMLLSPFVREKGGKVGHREDVVKVSFDCDFKKFEAALTKALDRAQ